MIKEIQINTNKRNEMIDINHLIEKEIINIDEGIVTIFVPHTTAGVTINENADPDVKSDILRKLSEIIPENDNYKHVEGNSDSHLKTLITGSNVQLIVRKGKLVLGTWQSIFFCEYDGPRQRKFIIKY
jgi:secondary thiamine-phosphate synthase enzyme